jgi:purine-nucleoside phosphorylase
MIPPVSLLPLDPPRRVDARVTETFDASIAAIALRRRIPGPPEVLVVGGSGLDALADGLGDPIEIPFADVPGLPSAGVGGHAGRYRFGRIGDRRVLVQSGRFHLYEGHSVEIVLAPVRIAAALGARVAILTNAAGGIRGDLMPGHVVAIRAHLDLMGRGGASSHAWAAFLGGGPPRPMEIYDPELLRLAAAAAPRVGLQALQGCYAAVLGPSYETPAEVRMLAALGADLVGMSTVPEALAAREVGMAVLALSVVTDRAGGGAAGASGHAGASHEVVSHEAVLEAAREAAPRLTALVREIVGMLDP